MTGPNNGRPLLVVQDLVVQFSRGVRRGVLTAVDHVSLEVREGETVGLVGESGSGKSTTGNAILGLVRPAGGRIEFDGKEITHASFKERRAVSEHLQVVFQDPYSSLNPSRTVAQTLAEPLLVHRKLSEKQCRKRIEESLERVRLDPRSADLYPASFSGGQRQRIAIARALMLEPKLVVCDEPVSGLDLSTQAQILNLLKDLQKEMGMAFLFVSHDLAVVRYMAHRIIVLKDGQIKESGDAHQIYTDPQNEYTRLLLESSPVPEPARQAARRLARVKIGNA